ncbi:charged multivesicular body protein 2Ba isoform X2 [Brachyhypopomus gauderio]|uniref:charged multivesicular body protein 2Ba isoform X2 n=1 Tax=Brachyhypopomus gauderio TaxID=698409 RepID=UPI00404255E8
MASLFKKKTVDDVIKEQTKELRGTQRQITRDRAALEREEKQIEMEIKKMAKTGNREACKILAKQLVQVRKQKNRTYAVSSKVTSMSTQTKVMNSQMKMAGAMSTTAKTMQAVNKKMDPKKTLMTMQDFQKENMKMEMTEDMTPPELVSQSMQPSPSLMEVIIQADAWLLALPLMVRAPAAGKSRVKAPTISNEDIERQLKALGVD